MNMEMNIPVLGNNFIFFGCIPRNGIASSYGSCIFNFGGTSILCSKVTLAIYI